MKRVKLGRTALEVSPVGFGGIPIIPLGMEEAAEVVGHCLEMGITLFDTANAYRDSERKIGLALEGARHRVVLATKTAARDANEAASHIQMSLENLRTSYIDIYQLHNVSNPQALKEVLSPSGAYQALKRARKEGRIRFIGITSHNVDIAIEACRTGLFDTLQFPFNFVEREAAGDLFNVAREMDMGIIAMKPMGGGVLEDARLCLGFLQQYPDVVPIPGIKSQQEAREMVSLYEDPVKLEAEDWVEIERIRRELGSRFCHRCEYCMPCEQGIPIPSVLSSKALLKRFSREVAAEMLREPMEKVELCTECGSCVERCPYELEIPRLLRENRELFFRMGGK